jgi:KDO2-lipid IV(A) lauroyltransferase
MSTQRSGLRNRVELAAYLVARKVAGGLGPHGLSRIGATLGALFWRVSRGRREIVRFNLALAFPGLADTVRERWARDTARHFGRILLDTLRLQRLEPDALLREVTVSGREHREAAMASGRGAFFLTGHIGQWEVAALVTGLELPHGLAVVNRPLDNPLLDVELEAIRSRFGNRVLGKRNIARGIMRELGDQAGVGVLIDQRARPEVGVTVPFFGHPALTHPILARFARRTGAPVVPTFALWEGPGRYSLRYEAPICIEELAPEDREDVPLTARLTACIEEAIRERPGQWLWFHDRWQDLRRA